MDVVEIARFADVYEAEIAAARLRADGFAPTLGGAEHAKADPLILQALGWVRLSVPENEAFRARALLQSLRAGGEIVEPSTEVAPDRSLFQRHGFWAAVSLLAVVVIAIMAGS
jgi:hypothetical protein